MIGVSTDRTNHRSLTRRAASILCKLGPLRGLMDFISSTRFVVHGDSLSPKLAHNDHLLVSRMAFRLDYPSRGDVVAFRLPYQPNETFIKRIAGLPGEAVKVRGVSVVVDDRPLNEPYHSPSSHSKEASHITQEWHLGENEYFLVGDNRSESDDRPYDSRSFGPVTRDLIVGKAWLRYWPRNAWGRIR